ncbi:MAG: transcriptional regulator [Actinomycetota bacterium]|nr:transcriptional regulator [Actinomycetota bacterium]
MEDFDYSLEKLSLLGEDLRRRMYMYVREQAKPVSRDEVARAMGVSRKLVAFHLDKLAEEGLLEYHYQRPPGRSGPGAGRPAKLYRPSEIELEVSIPERRYDLVGRLLVDSIRNESPKDGPREHAFETAREAGMSLGEKVRREERLRPPGAERALAVASQVLSDHGFEPARQGDEVILRNCPFHELSRHAPDLVCGMNQAFIEGLIRGLGNETVDAALEPEPGQCCVKLRRRSASAEGESKSSAG